MDAILVQPDGMILVGGRFSLLGGLVRPAAARLHADGALDLGFSMQAGHPWVVVSCLALQTDGKILAGGRFVPPGSMDAQHLARLNRDGTLDPTFNPGAGFDSSDLSVDTLAVQPDRKILVGGQFTFLGGQPRNYLGRLNLDGTPDLAFNPGADGRVSALVLQADGKILVGGEFTVLGGQPRSRVGRLHPDGTPDLAFNPRADNRITSLAMQPDGKVLVGGDFTTLGGQRRERIARLNPDGTLDTTFNPGANGRVSSLVIQADGRILVSGQFTTLGGHKRQFLGRLNTNGSLDVTFGPGQGPNNSVNALAVQPDGKIVVGGRFTALGSHPRSRLARLNPDGTPDDTSHGTLDASVGWTLDQDFNPGTTDETEVRTLVVQTDRKILVGGQFRRLAGQARSYLGRLHLNGTLDIAFDPRPDARVDALVLQGDGKILVSGPFKSLGGHKSPYLGRLNPDGTFDQTFDLGEGPNRSVTALAIQTDGKIVVGGAFSTLGGQPREGIARLNPDGTVDSTFIPGAGWAVFEPRWNQTRTTGGSVNALALQADGKILVAGRFNTLSGQKRHYLGRLNTDGTLDETFEPDDIVDMPVDCLALQRDGRILISGQKTHQSGRREVRREFIARLHSDGTLDSAFTEKLAVDPSDRSIHPHGKWRVHSLVLQPDGKILVAGSFERLGAFPLTGMRQGLGRLHPDGSLDLRFDPSFDLSFDPSWERRPFVYSLAVQSDGDILVGGKFRTLNGQPRYGLARLK